MRDRAARELQAAGLVGSASHPNFSAEQSDLEHTLGEADPNLSAEFDESANFDDGARFDPSLLDPDLSSFPSDEATAAAVAAVSQESDDVDQLVSAAHEAHSGTEFTPATLAELSARVAGVVSAGHVNGLKRKSEGGDLEAEKRTKMENMA